MVDIKEYFNILNIIELIKYSILMCVVRIIVFFVFFVRKWKIFEVYNDNIFIIKEMLEVRNLLFKVI